LATKEEAAAITTVMNINQDLRGCWSTPAPGGKFGWENNVRGKVIIISMWKLF
jgi:hypothetical protein